MATLLIGDNEFNGRIVCDGQINTECSEFINYGSGVEVFHLYISSGFISKSLLKLYRKSIGSTDDWTLDFEIEIGGYHDYVWESLLIYGTDSAYKVTFKGLTKYYTIVSPCTPNWQCRIPLDGYETDVNNCGEADRPNNICVDQCEGVICDNICQGNDIWSQKCVSGNCVLDKLIQQNSITCGYDPCDGVVCDNICQGNDLWSQICDPETGVCKVDQLLESNSATCMVTDYIPTDESTIKLYLVMGGLAFAGLGMVLLAKNK